MLQAPEAHLVIAGEVDPHIKRSIEFNLRRLTVKPDASGPVDVSSHVHLLGERSDVPELLACCDVFCQPSLWEGCPYALIEAAAAGCALAGSDIPGITDIIHPGKTGWLAPADDAPGLAATLTDALSDAGERQRRGLAASQLVRQRHSLKRMVDLTGTLYEQVAIRPVP